MNKEILDFVVEQTNALINAPSCSKEAKDAAEAWLKAVGTDAQAEETKRYIAELEEDIMPIDMLIGFAESDSGAQLFGAEVALKVAVHAKEIKAASATHCDCPACAAAAEILQKKDALM